jgi:hypothetical protein
LAHRIVVVGRNYIVQSVMPPVIDVMQTAKHRLPDHLLVARFADRRIDRAGGAGQSRGAGCPYRKHDPDAISTRLKSGPDILVMQASEDRKRNDRAACCGDAGRTMDQCILVQHKDKCVRCCSNRHRERYLLLEEIRRLGAAFDALEKEGANRMALDIQLAESTLVCTENLVRIASVRE